MIRSNAVALALAAVACSHEMPRPAPLSVEQQKVQPAERPAPVEQKPAAPPAPPLLPGEEAALGTQPNIQPLQPFDAPAPQIVTLPNGLELYLIERKGDGLEAVELVVKGGASSDPAGKEGLASLTAALMEAGAAGRSQTQLAAAADAIGASISVNALQDAVAVSASGLGVNLRPMVKLLADVSLRPNLLASEWKKVQAQRTQELIAERSVPRSGAAHAFAQACYGDGPLGHPVQGTSQSVKALQLGDVKAFFARFAPGDAALIAVGGVPAAEVTAALRDAFGAWKPGAASKLPAPPAAARVDRPRLVLVDYPGRPQSEVIIGEPAVPRSSPDFLALSALNAVLGGSFTSRLNQNLREQHGYTYGAFSRFAFGAEDGPFQANAAVKTEVTGASVTEMLKELDTIIAQPLARDDLEKARALLAYRLVETLSHADALAAAVSGLFVYGLPNDEFQTWVPRLKALDVDAVRAAGARVLHPPQMTITIAGDRSQVEAQLKPLALPPPQLRDPEGRLLGR